MTRATPGRPVPKRPPPVRPTAPRTIASGTFVWPSVSDMLAPRGPWLVPLLLLVVTRLLMLRLTPTLAEDAFITFRYARNLAAGSGLVYNPGEHMMGFTSPLWTVWTALGSKITGTPTLWALVWSFAADLVTLIVGGSLVAATVGPAGAFTFNFFFAAWPYFAALTVSGMEMSTCVALLLLAAALVSTRSRAAGPVLAALALSRPEGFVAACILALGAPWRDRLVALAITGAGVAALAFQFGDPIPNTLRVKANVYGTPGPWVGRHWWEWISPVVMGRWPGSGDPIMASFLAVVTAPAAVLGAIELWRRRETALARAVAALLAIWLGYAALGVAYFWWYFAFPLVAAALLVSVGLPRVTRGRAIPIALGLFVLSVWSIAISLYRGRSYSEAHTFGTMASALEQRCRPGDTVMLEPIGMIGYTCPVVVIDETGLVSPQVAKRRLQGPGWYTDTVRERRPRWLVVRRSVLQSESAFAGVGRPFRSAAERDSLFRDYHVDETSGDEKSDNSLVLLERAG